MQPDTTPQPQIAEQPEQVVDRLYEQSLLIARRMVRPCEESALKPADNDSNQELVEAVIGRCVQALAQGSTSVTLSAMVEMLNQNFEQRHTPQSIVEALSHTPWCFVGPIDEADSSALLIIENQKVSLTKYAQLESECARRVASLMNNAPMLPSVAQAQEIIGKLMRVGEGILSPQQVRALVAAICNRFMVVTGGPGTGKTTVVVRILETLRALADLRGEQLSIRLAAPTGKAAQRLQESIDASVTSLSKTSQDFFDQVDRACTVQSLLGQRYGALTSYKHSTKNPLWGDVFVIDEVSMMPLDLMVVLLQCLPPHARLILVGDPYQLASVEAGTVISDIVEGMKLIDRDCPAQTFFMELDNLLADQWHEDNASLSRPSQEPWDKNAQARCARGLVELTRAHRFGDNVGGLVQAIKAAGEICDHSNMSEVSKGCENSDSDDSVSATNPATQEVFAQTLRFDSVPSDDSANTLPRIYPTLTSSCEAQISLEEQLVDCYRTLEELMSQGKVDQALNEMDSVRLLCANNRGAKGAQEVNLRLAGLLHKANPKQPTNQYGERLGCVLMVTRNDRLLGISNGDTGLLGKTEDGLWYVYFPDGSDGNKPVPRSRIECITLAYAITIHKSQGSQYKHAIVQLAATEDSPLNVRELFYTGVSRAQEKVSIVGSNAAITRAIQTSITRASGLTERLIHLFNDKGSV